METALSYMVAFPTEQVNKFFAQGAFLLLLPQCHKQSMLIHLPLLFYALEVF